MAEIIDFGPRYDLNDAGFELSADNRSGCGGGPSVNELEDDNAVEETPPRLQRLSGSLRHLSLKQLEIVQSLSTISDNDELEDGELVSVHSPAALGTHAADLVLGSLDASMNNLQTAKGIDLQVGPPLMGQPLIGPNSSGPPVFPSHSSEGPTTRGPADSTCQPLLQPIAETSSLPACQPRSSKVEKQLLLASLKLAYQRKRHSLMFLQIR